MTNLAHAFTGNDARYTGEVFGIEVEAERLSTREYALLREGAPPEQEALRSLFPTWRMTTDGSLRHNGVEFVTPRAYVYEDAVAAVKRLYPVFAEGIVRSSVRAGIHIHYNMVHRTAPEFLRFLQTYVLLEPLLFQVVGREREQNIYCIPLYSADNEMEVWRRTIKAALHPRAGMERLPRLEANASCKYSALYIGPMRTFGSVEFRHAPTWSKATDLLRWLAVVKRVGEVTIVPTGDGCVSAVPDLFHEVVKGLNIDWRGYFHEVEERGLVERARSLEPCTYKVKQWGSPAGMVFAAAAVPQRVQERSRLRLGAVNLADIVRELDEEPPVEWVDAPEEQHDDDEEEF